ncbi:hypothetical protein KDW_09610 [Dictyobacter vulcani]|uniref:Chlor_Arch_YYY domain-containing protein n=1 Tax=Dictyobacter vulcani TaxID=2607529 RepID=A0A5J4KKW3_9CHLR|nr:DUF2298 domain-containing protein [Dictyobacter vulcani]GER86799.1 hypothetical protein KDW_09610 [Dictyobacter vulcani]
MSELFQMWMLVEVLGLLCLPLTFTVFRNLPDRGWAFSKVLGVIILAFCVWILLMCLHSLPYSQIFIFGIFLILAACSGFAFLSLWQEMLQLARRHLLYIVSSEVVFLGMMVLLGILRSLKPDIYNFEMFMDAGFVASIMRSSHFPPNDMWFAGHSINYYYYAHYTIATLAKLIGQSASIAFNTGICFFYGLTALNLFGVTCNIIAWSRQRTQRAGDDAVNEKSSLKATLPYGLLSIFLALIVGNLAATQQWWDHHAEAGFTFNWFTPSRVIDGTINEFPAFSFLLSCFHAHVLTLAFTIFCIGLALNWFLEPAGKGFALFGTGWSRYLNLLVTAIVLGGLFVMNGWDYPTYMGLTLVAIGIQQGLAHRPWLRFSTLLHVALVAISLVGLSYYLYLPFYLNFVSPSQGIGIASPTNHSTISSEILIYGLFIFMFLSLLVCSALLRPFHTSTPAPSLPDSPVYPVVDRPSNPGPAVSSGLMFETGPYMEHILQNNEEHLLETPSVQVAVAEQEEKGETEQVPAQRLSRRWFRLLWLGIALFLVSCLVVLYLFPYYTTCVAGLSLALLGVSLLFYQLENRAHAFTLFLGAAAFTIIAGCEIFFLKDIFSGGTAQRMNTLFKFYFQAWALLSICSGAGLYFIIESLHTLKVRTRKARWILSGVVGAWSLGLVLLVLASMTYPLLAPYTRYWRIDDTHAQPYLLNTQTLDGMAYLAHCQPPVCDYDTSADYQAIRWLNTHVSGDPVIVEANGDDYHYGGRVSAFTGLPTLINWPGHEFQWRVNWLNNPQNQDDFHKRSEDLDKIYTASSSMEVLSIMDYYDAQYIYVGAFEHKKYPDADLKRFGKFMQTVYHEHGVVIYKVE